MITLEQHKTLAVGTLVYEQEHDYRPSVYTYIGFVDVRGALRHVFVSLSGDCITVDPLDEDEDYRIDNCYLDVNEAFACYEKRLEESIEKLRKQLEFDRSYLIPKNK